MIIISDEIIKDVEQEFKTILVKNSIDKISNFKWSKFNNINKVNAFKDFFNFISHYLLNNQMYIHVLIWDTDDSRHSVFPRDDNKNLGIMYHKIIKNFVKYNLNDEDSLFIYPDRQNCIDWQLIEEILEKEGFFNMEYGRTVKIEESNTENAYLIQIADIFAGIGRTSYMDYDEYEIHGDTNQTVLIPFDDTPSVKNKTRFRILNFFHRWAKNHNLQISMSEKRGLKSHKKGPVNFWLYEPQSEKDKAPKTK